jgi:hypothetical protein
MLHIVLIKGNEWIDIEYIMNYIKIFKCQEMIHHLRWIRKNISLIFK